MKVVIVGARYADPYSCGIGNSMRFLAFAPYDNTMKVKGVKKLLELPCETIIGQGIDYTNEHLNTDERLSEKHTFSCSVLFEILKKKNLYKIVINEIKLNIQKLRLDNIFS